jgi:hypothetical protein
MASASSCRGIAYLCTTRRKQIRSKGHQVHSRPQSSHAWSLHWCSSITARVCCMVRVRGNVQRAKQLALQHRRNRRVWGCTHAPTPLCSSLWCQKANINLCAIWDDASNLARPRVTFVLIGILRWSMSPCNCYWGFRPQRTFYIYSLSVRKKIWFLFLELLGASTLTK